MFTLGLSAATCLIIALGLALYFRLKTNRLARDRQHVGINDFISYFRRLGVPDDVSAAVYENLSKLPWMRNFPVAPADILLDVYALADEDLADVYNTIATLTHRVSLGAPRKDIMQVQTVEDLVKLVASLPKSVQI